MGKLSPACQLEKSGHVPLYEAVTINHRSPSPRKVGQLLGSLAAFWGCIPTKSDSKRHASEFNFLTRFKLASHVWIQRRIQGNPDSGKADKVSPQTLSSPLILSE